MANTTSNAVRIEEHVDGIVSSIGPKVKNLRREQRLSLQQLAVKADVSAAAIHKIERNDMVPTITTLLKIATALDRPVTYFVELGDGQPEPVAFTPASARPAVFTPHAGLTLEGVSGPYAPFRSAAAVATVAPGADSGDRPLVHAGEELVYTLEELTDDKIVLVGKNKQATLTAFLVRGTAPGKVTGHERPISNVIHETFTIGG